MDYIGNIFRPPSEAESLLLQVSVGCSHNRCSFCAMYKDKSFQKKPLETVFRDIDEAAAHPKLARRIFLCDGDALALPQNHLITILERIRARLPGITRISAYASSHSILGKSVEDLTALRELGLSLLYQGVESGSARVLLSVGKGSTPADAVEAARRLRIAGLRHSVMFLLGLGGVDASEEHAAESGKLLTQINPSYASALTLMLVPETPLWHSHRKGEFLLPDPFQILNELRLLLLHANPERCLFSANHASNALPLQGWLPRDQQKLLDMLQHVIEKRETRLLVPDWMRGL